MVLRLHLNLLFLLFSPHLFGMQKVIVVFGPSCSGKSTLSKNIAHSLGQEWRAVDRDDLIENGILDSDDLLAFADSINKQAESDCLVIDTNLYTDSFFNLLKADHKLRVLVYAPLVKLIERDELRNQRLQRPPERAKRARLFVINNYRYFFNSEPNYNTGQIEDSNAIFTPYTFDFLVNSVSVENSAVTIEAIKKRLLK